MTVGRAEVVAPLGDAVGFIDGNASEFALAGDCAEDATERLGEDEFRCYVEESCGWVSTTEVFHDLFAVVGAGGGVDGCCWYACLCHGVDLIVHEGEQGRYHNCNSMIDNCWKLKTETLAKGRPCLHEDIVPFKSGDDDLTLIRPEALLAKDTPEGEVDIRSRLLLISDSWHSALRLGSMPNFYAAKR